MRQKAIYMKLSQERHKHRYATPPHFLVRFFGVVLKVDGVDVLTCSFGWMYKIQGGDGESMDP